MRRHDCGKRMAFTSEWDVRELGTTPSAGTALIAARLWLDGRTGFGTKLSGVNLRDKP
jgi:hypothetical protein